MPQAAVNLFKLIVAGAQWPDRLIACLGAATCITLTMIVSATLSLTAADLPAIVAPLGASAVLVFAVPTSPLAQPWPVAGGNIVSALVGVAIFRLVPHAAAAARLAVAGAILAMSLLRCLHPPGGAAALTAVVGGPAIHDAGYALALAPVGVNSIVLVALAAVFHRMRGRTYPHRAVAPPVPTAGPSAADIDAALEDLHEGFDISREDLAALLTRAEHHARMRRAGR